MSFVKLPVQIEVRKIIMPNLDITYPFIINENNPAATQKINSTILNKVKELIKEQGYYKNPKETQVDGQFEIKTNERGVLSLSISNYTYVYHAAHGLTIIKSFNFDIESGKNYELGELFKPGSDYTKILSDIIEKQIKERQIDLIEDYTGLKPEQDYYIADAALVIYYQLYDLTPYAYGFPIFPISVYDIQDIINENGLLGVMAINF
ncbi:MAG: DUF3298 domain-containing protein [Ignavibacteriales bacterium]